jgi:hypothetical protein
MTAIRDLASPPIDTARRVAARKHGVDIEVRGWRQLMDKPGGKQRLG